ncbi:conserved hypothetical protein [Streptococcus equi subsp. zooepidemicus ATCC 35246]|nr:conserved hypothetical protein [Streptococcus equi subsp. zooepidemicus ATCC 35246]
MQDLPELFSLYHSHLSLDKGLDIIPKASLYCYHYSDILRHAISLDRT